MQKLLSYFLAGALLLPAAAKIGGVAHFFANFNYYSSVLCVNKATPESNCHGTCQLTEQLAGETPTQEPKHLPHSLSLELMPFFAQQHQFSFVNFKIFTKRHMPPYFFAFAEVAADVPLRPPIFLG